MSILLAIFGVVAVLFLLAQLKVSFSDENTKLFRKLWSSKRLNNAVAIKQEIDTHEKILDKFGVNLTSADQLDEDAVLDLLLAASDFDRKHPNNLGTLILDEVSQNLTRSATVHGGPDEREALQKKLSEAMSIGVAIIGMQKVSAQWGMSTDDLFKGIWDEAEESERAKFKENHPTLVSKNLYKEFFKEMVRESPNIP